MEEPRIPKTEEGEAEPQRDQEHAHRVFRNSRDCAPWICPEGQTVNAEFYCNILRRLREDIRRKRPELWCAGNWLLHDNNAPSYRALVTREFLAHRGIITLPHPPYSPDLAPCDFFFFPKMKLQLKGRRFDRVEKIQRASQNVLGKLRKQDFQHAFQQWQRRWDRCVAAQGAILKGILPKPKSSK